MYEDVLKFWFEEAQPAQWWKKDDAFDRLIIERFSQVHFMASRCELFDWRASAKGRLAEIIVLDQFSRHMFRESPQSFAHESLALALAQEAIAAGAESQLSQIERNLLYMPFMHSESLKIHDVAMELFSKNGIDNSLDYEIRHRKIIEQFGRFPHRNAVLGRISTVEEIEFLKQPGSGF